jgi:anaerobic selenocysteine-containing dehydrogenase
MPPPLGTEQVPLFTRGRREGQGMLLPGAILNGKPYPVRAMLIAGSNPLVTFPHVDHQAEVLRKLDFLAVFDLFMTPTAEFADLVIPGADQLDNLELHDYGRVGATHLGLMRPATISPKGWPTWKLVFEIARSLGLSDLFPWENNRQALAYRLTDTTVTLNDLEESESSTVAYAFDQPSGERWHTSDGKVHYRSKELYATGNHALPGPDAIDLPRQADAEYPFWLSTGDRVAVYQHGQFRGIPEYEKLVPEPTVDIHPNAAQRLGIQSGEPVVLSTRYGRIELSAHITPEVREDCLRMIHGWEQANANELTSLEHLDTVSGYPWLRALPGRIDRKAGQS